MTALTCAFGRPWPIDPRWKGDPQSHCAGCHAESRRLQREFSIGVFFGEHDADGYTPVDRRAQARRKDAAA